jgi:hypothetical protein
MGQRCPETFFGTSVRAIRLSGAGVVDAAPAARMLGFIGRSPNWPGA